MNNSLKLIVSFVVACMLSIGTIFAAANPFADVYYDDWSYKAVKILAREGIIDDSHGCFLNERKSITRYEIAQMVAQAMYRQAKASDEQKDVIAKLVAEYSDELQTLGVNTKNKAIENEWKITGWAQTENTYGNTYGPTTVHEYNYQIRLGFKKQISDKLGVYYQIKNKCYLDATSATDDTTMRTRQAFFTYKPTPDTTINAGKIVYWLANGLFMDATGRTVDISTKLTNNLTFFGFVGRYEGNLASTISYGNIGGKIGAIDIGTHYLSGRAIANKMLSSKIPALTVGYTLPSGLNISGGYAKNIDASDNNNMYKAQLWQIIGENEYILQYWRQEGNMNLPVENGDHLTWWSNQYGTTSFDGFDGYRGIIVHHFNANLYSETWYGDYKDLVTNLRAKKYGWDLTIGF
ncbi:MAG: S-layer protein [Firmicutes bacterium]|nr:S-layer protein [Bacillota bacterium]